MKIANYITRRGRLKTKLEESLLGKTLTHKEIDNILYFVDTYEKDNLDTIEKLKRTRHNELARINGALKQTIQAHGPITKELIGSASKRIYGSLLTNKKRILTTIFNFFRLK